MKFYSFFLSAVLLGFAAAGGIRGAYERLFIWYAYRAEIEFLGTGNLASMVICPGWPGHAQGRTMNFNEFIEYTNRPAAAAGPGAIPNIVNANNLTPNIDTTAKNMFQRRQISGRWNAPQRIIAGTGGYTPMLRAVAQRFFDVKGHLDANNEGVRKAIDAVQKVSLSREIDYEKYRMPEMEKAPEFTGQNKLDFVTWNVQLQNDGNAKSLDVPATEAQTAGATARIDTWRNTVYHADTTLVNPQDPNSQTKGQERANHWGAFQNAKRTENLAKTGSATC